MKLNAKLNEHFPLPYYFDVVDATHSDHEGILKHIEEEGKVIYQPSTTTAK